MKAKSNGRQTVSAENAAEMVRRWVEAHDGAQAAAKRWGVTDQLVRMVIKGIRNPTEAMLADLGLEKLKSEIRYRRVGGK